MMTPTLIDMFCGAGGMSHGFEQAGFSVIAGLDFDPDSVATFRANHPNSKALQADLSKLSPEQLGKQLDINPGELDCLAGGPPCQGFSKNRAFRHVDGIFVDDPRNHLYWHFFDYVKYLQPKIVLMENVPEILIKANGYFRDAVFERFHSLGYIAEARIINAAEYGVPQSRRRAFFLAARDGMKVSFPEPTTLPGPRAGHRTPNSVEYVGTQGDVINLSLFDTLPIGPTVWDAISDLHGVYAGDLNEFCVYKSEPLTHYQLERRNDADSVWNHFPWQLTERQLKRIRLLREGQGQLHLPEELQTKNGYGSAYRRMQSDAQALTITTWMFHPGSGMFTHPFDDRVITIREAARIQSFQDDFVFSGKYHSQCRQVGNAVAPLVAKNIALSIINTLGYLQSQGSLLIRAIP
ncbi:MAG: DNA cytosine methyltransferase [Roseiflexaceae bacterium]|nr:DNA cytosine methyltransferase [Roseiflexaceae bacterium]